ncbi:hypothetical protein, partial [Gimesia algae]|uniref:hypothetical protein n=1 Tax=Gimesia algae TaxID=2527971 RepID=UPI001E30E87B
AHIAHWEIRPQWSLRQNHARRAGHDYLGSLTFQLVQGWGQGQQSDTKPCDWCHTWGHVSNFILKSLSQHEKVIPFGNDPCVSLPKGMGFSQVRELAQKCRECRDKQQRCLHARGVIVVSAGIHNLIE